MKGIFIDTSGFVALASKTDRNHVRAGDFYARSPGRRPLLTSTYVANEVITLVRMRIGHAVAVEVGRSILDSRWCRMLDIDEELRESAWNLFTRYADEEFSFTDCTSFAVMKALGLDEAFHIRPPRLRGSGLYGAAPSVSDVVGFHSPRIAPPRIDFVFGAPVCDQRSEPSPARWRRSALRRRQQPAAGGREQPGDRAGGREEPECGQATNEVASSQRKPSLSATWVLRMRKSLPLL